MRILTFVQIFLLSFLLSCVGTVTETQVPENRLSGGTATTFQFQGIQIARTVSHNRIEIEFLPLAPIEDYEFLLYINDSQTPIKLDPNSLYQSLGGRLLYTIGDRATGRQYKLKLTATNIKTGATSTNENVVYSETFDNQVADFDGVSKVSLTPGSKTNSMDINWIAPKMSGLVAAGEHDPVCYQVTYISEVGGAGNLNANNYTGEDRVVKYIPECYKKPGPQLATPFSNPDKITIDGLRPDTTYFVQVRAIHKAYYDRDYNNVPNISVNVDSNTKYLRIKTERATTDLDFDPASVILSNGTGIKAFDHIDVAWKPASGIFQEYRVYHTKYTGSGDPATDDLLTEAVIAARNTANNYKAVPSNETFTSLSGLETGAYYQVKVALCPTLACPVSEAVISEVKVLQVVARLASFTGIHFIENPGQFSENDMVNLKFDPPVITDGYATDLEFYCVNPDDKEDMILIPTNTPLTGSSISRCNGLYLEVTSTIELDKYKQQKIKGIIADGSTQYCFAATPAIIGYTPEQRLDVSNRIVRCSYPEVKPPTLEQFPGITNNCSIDGRKSTLQWNLPNGGIYSGFQVFWKEKTSGQIFSFAEAISGAPGYLSSTNLNADVQEYVVDGLIPGKVYQFGVLATTNLPAPIGMLYSEYNLNILECNLPLPTPSFKGFSRIFAIGPKVDGRVPNDLLTKAPSPSARLFEAINSDGIPYEVPLASEGVPNTDASYYLPPPGRDYATFLSDFDGRKSTHGAVSRDGIVSLAWEEVSFSNPDILSLFTSSQPNTNDPRPSRKWGYKVYRSHDNKLTWQNVTDQSGVIYSMDYAYRKRANTDLINQRMAFFTDYTVSSLQEYHDPSKGRDIDRARIYYYKIVPVFDGKELSFPPNAQHNIVKVTLPPPNMALVHRWMANRSHCLSMDKDVRISDDYSCEYNGIGSVGQAFPYRTGSTKYDQSGDLLVDRFELGCRFTRGDKVDDPATGLSHFDSALTSRPGKGDQTIYPQFQGYKTNGTFPDTSSAFRGCISQHSLASQSTPTGYKASYDQYIHGDCTGSSGLNLFPRTCTADQFSGLNPDVPKVTGYNYLVPGLPAQTELVNCSLPPEDPNFRFSHFESFKEPETSANFIMQSEFLAVFHNRFASTSRTRNFPIWGPAKGFDPDQPIDPDSNPEKVNMKVNNSWTTSNQCSINLASIDSEGYMKPRWIEVNDLSGGRISYKDDTAHNFIEMTVNEIIEVETNPSLPQTFYNGHQDDVVPPLAHFRLPNQQLRDINNPRYRGTTQLGRILSSNAAKLPPLGGVTQNTAQALCATNWVEVGIANDSSHFAATEPVKNKRLMRRTEMITAGAWPEHYDEERVAQVESDPDTPLVAGSCLNNERNNIGQNIFKGDFINNNNTLYSGPNLTANYVPLITGSSPYNLYSSQPQMDHSQLCTSKFGVQDIVGNMSEITSERIFCDYSGDKIYLGKVLPGWPGTQNTRFMGDNTGPQIEFFNTNAERENAYVLYEDGTETFEIKRVDTSVPDTDPGYVVETLSASPGHQVAPWVQRDTNSGYCSIVDADAAARTSGSRFADLSGYWKNIFLPGGNINTDIIKRTQPDQKAVERLRNGDGFFLDFGPNSLLPSLKFTNTIALTPPSGIPGPGDDPAEFESIAEGKYFNPIVGLPLSCNNNSCKSPLLPEANDSVAISTEDLNENVETGTDEDPTILDFPIGNSQIYNTGLSTYNNNLGEGHKTGVGIYTITPAADTREVITSMTINAATGNLISKTTKVFPRDYLNDGREGDQIELYRMVWDIARGTVFMMTSGGAANMQKTGRYTAQLQAGGNTYSNTPHRGFRCAIMVNEE